MSNIAPTAEINPGSGRRLAATAGRYGLSAAGPIGISGAHFIAAALVFHSQSPALFGLFSFVMTIVPFAIGAVGSLVGAPTTIGIRQRGYVDARELATFQKINLIIAAFVVAIVSASLILSGLGPFAAILFGLYGAVMSLRWLGRIYAFSMQTPVRATASDIIYGVIVLGGLGVLSIMDRLSMPLVAGTMLVASLVSLVAFDFGYVRQQIWPSSAGRIADYAPVWRDLTRWSVLGVVATEITVNAHAYFVTFFSGPQAFALLALGSFLMRPASLVLSSLPDLERPVMARAIGAGTPARAYRAVTEFRVAASIVLVATIALSAALLTFAPGILLKKGYGLEDAIVVIAIWSVIMAIRTLRQPDAVFLQAAGLFKPLANAAIKSSIVSLIAVPVLLFASGPIPSLLGIAAGDLVMTADIVLLVRRWRRDHG
ncbi:MAG TPA: hypothetical protein VGU69_08405 [Rhizomicrobium sp.]|nr:hypothetical protein [Rhizomicrobium sp.]